MDSGESENMADSGSKKPKKQYREYQRIPCARVAGAARRLGGDVVGGYQPLRHSSHHAASLCVRRALWYNGRMPGGWRVSGEAEALQISAKRV